MTRFLDVLMDTHWSERRLFVEACIAAEDIKALQQFDKIGLSKNTLYYLFGKKERCKIYKDILTRKAEISHPISIISEDTRMDALSIHGALSLAKKAKII